MFSYSFLNEDLRYLFIKRKENIKHVPKKERVFLCDVSGYMCDIHYFFLSIQKKMCTRVCGYTFFPMWYLEINKELRHAVETSIAADVTKISHIQT